MSVRPLPEGAAMDLPSHLPTTRMLDATAPVERASLSLDGAWAFRMDGEVDWRETVVPAPWQAQFDDLRHGAGAARSCASGR